MATHAAPPDRLTAASTRRTARIAGALFLVTFVTSIPAALLFDPVLDDPGWITGSGSETRILVGALLEALLIVANIGTAVVLYPVVRRQSEGLALGYVTARLVECAFIAVGVLSVLAIVTLRQDLAGGGTDPETLTTVGASLVAVKDWTFLLGPGFVVGWGNGLILGWLMYRSGLVPPRLALLGLIGGPLIVASGAAILLGAFDAGSALQVVATVPEFFWELLLGLYLTFRGFRPASRLFARGGGATSGEDGAAVAPRVPAPAGA
jgi:hypothetical protein